MKYLIENGQNIFDVVNNTLNDINLTYSLIIDNNIPDVNTCPVGLTVEYVQQPATPPIINTSNPVVVVTSKEYVSQTNQTVFDVCLQTYAGIDKMYSLIVDSGYSSVNDYPKPSTVFVYNPTQIYDTIFSYYLQQTGKVLVTGDFSNFTQQSDGLLTDSSIQIITGSGINIIVD